MDWNGLNQSQAHMLLWWAMDGVTLHILYACKIWPNQPWTGPRQVLKVTKKGLNQASKIHRRMVLWKAKNASKEEHKERGLPPLIKDLKITPLPLKSCGFSVVEVWFWGPKLEGVVPALCVPFCLHFLSPKGPSLYAFLRLGSGLFLWLLGPALALSMAGLVMSCLHLACVV